jgi:hydrogenase nickel incorporation protein HypA/HybF
VHELSIALSIVDGALEELERRGAPEASAIHLRVGRLSGVDKDALLFSFAAASQETALAASRLVIEDVDVSVLCPACNTERPARSFPALTCAECGALAQHIIHGQELEITAMELVG